MSPVPRKTAEQRAEQIVKETFCKHQNESDRVLYLMLITEAIREAEEAAEKRGLLEGETKCFKECHEQGRLEGFRDGVERMREMAVKAATSQHCPAWVRDEIRALPIPQGEAK